MFECQWKACLEYPRRPHLWIKWALVLNYGKAVIAARGAEKRSVLQRVKYDGKRFGREELYKTYLFHIWRCCWWRILLAGQVFWSAAGPDYLLGKPFVHVSFRL